MVSRRPSSRLLLIRFSIVFAIAAVLSLLAWNHYRTAPTDMPLHGRIVISEPANFTTSGESCAGAGSLSDLAGGATIAITPATKDPVESTLQPGAITASGECEIAFTATVPEALGYTFRIGTLPELVRDHYIIDGTTRDGKMILSPILRWD